MSCYQLRGYDQTPPGGYPYQDPSGKLFPSLPLIESQAQTVAAWRSANGKPRATVKEALQDVDHYQCARLGNMGNFCVPCGGPAGVSLNVSSPIVAPPCKGCGARV